MTITDKQQSDVINALRFPLACLVVVIHCKVTSVDIMPQWDNITGAEFTNAIQIIFSSIISPVAVPTFFLISGYYFFYNTEHFNVSIYLDKLKKRFYSLFIPYIIWNSIFILKYVIIKFGAYILYNEPLSDLIVFWKDYGGVHMFYDCYVWMEDKFTLFGWQNAPSNSAPILFPLWFIRDLIIVIMCSPIIYSLIKYLKYYSILLLSFLYISGIWPNIHGLSSISVFFFSLGAYFSINKKNLIRYFAKYSKPSFIAYIILLAYLIFINTNKTPGSSIIYPIFIIVSVIAVINLMTYIYNKINCKCISKLAQTTFFIYAFHMLLANWIASLILNQFFSLENNSWLCTLVYYLLKPIFTITLCLATYYILDKFCPRILNILIGKRKIASK